MKAPEPKKDDQPIVQKEPPGEPVASPPPTKAPPVPKKRQSRLRSFLRDALRFTLFAVIFFMLGGLVFYFLGYLPSTRAAEQSRVDLEQARQRITELEAQVESLQSLEEANVSAKEEIDSARTHVLILSAQADVLEARLALANENPSEADLALTKTDSKLKSLMELLPTSQEQKVTDLQARLRLAIGELEKDQFAAASDLEVLHTQLMQLENALFTEA